MSCCGAKEKLKNEGRDWTHVVFPTVLLDRLLCDNVPCAEQDCACNALSYHWAALQEDTAIVANFFFSKKVWREAGESNTKHTCKPVIPKPSLEAPNTTGQTNVERRQRTLSGEDDRIVGCGGPRTRRTIHFLSTVAR